MIGTVIVTLSAMAMIIFAVIVLPLVVFILFRWKDEYSPGFCGVGATIFSAVALVPALIAFGLACGGEMDRATRWIGLAPAIFLSVVIAALQGAMRWHGRRRRTSPNR